MRFLIVFCHPNPASYSAALHRRVVAVLSASGHEIRDLDLYAIGFDPVMSQAEHSAYMTEPGGNVGRLREHVEHLHWAEGLAFVFPTWMYGPPTMLKGWLERAWLPGEAFTVPTHKGLPVGSGMRHIRCLICVTTSGSPWWWLKLVGDPCKALFTRALRVLFHPRCKTLWLQLYSMNNIGEAERRAFLQKVETRLARL